MKRPASVGYRLFLSLKKDLYDKENKTKSPHRSQISSEKKKDHD